MDIFLVFFFFSRMTAGTIHIDETFPEVKIGISVKMAVDTGHFA
jgi:hypothetical protein